MGIHTSRYIRRDANRKGGIEEMISIGIGMNECTMSFLFGFRNILSSKCH